MEGNKIVIDYEEVTSYSCKIRKWHSSHYKYWQMNDDEPKKAWLEDAARSVLIGKRIIDVKDSFDEEGFYQGKQLILDDGTIVCSFDREYKESGMTINGVEFE